METNQPIYPIFINPKKNIMKPEQLSEFRKTLVDIERMVEVQQCETLEDLSVLIRKFASKEGKIEGLYKEFDAQKMADYCMNYRNIYGHAPNVLTRHWGIRQQALYIVHTNFKEE